MKKMILIVIALLLIGALASAEAMLPSMFFGSRGLLVMDENQLASMGGENDIDLSGMSGTTMCAFSTGGDDGSPAIVVYDGEKMYVAFDMTAMFGNGALDAKGMIGIFTDFCKAYDYDVLMISGGGTGILYCRDTEALEKTLANYGDDSPVPEEIYHDKAEFIGACEAFVNQ